LKTGNPKKSAGKDRTTFSLRKKALKKPHPVQIDLLVTNGLIIDSSTQILFIYGSYIPGFVQRTEFVID